MRQCPACRTTVPPGLHGIRLECSHWVHTKCLDKKNPDFDQCVACKGVVDLNVPLVDVNEPTCIDGRDYVQEPVASNSVLSSLGRHKREPFTFLAEKKSIEWMIRNQGYGLQKMLQAGVTMNDFLNNGYTWQQLRTFKDLSEDAPSKERSRMALYALKTNAEHFRDHPHLLGSVIPDLEINGRHLVELYGFYFPENGQPLSVVGGKNESYWNASDLVKLGMKAQDLFGAGMETLDQYQHLQASQEDARALEMTGSDIESLYEPEPEIVRESVVVVEPAIVRVPVVVPKPKVKRVHGLKPRKK